MFPNDELTLEAERGRNPLYKHVAKTYLWMFFGLAITFAVGMTLYASNLVFFFYAVPMLSLVLLVAQLGLVIFLSARLTKISVNACRAVFVIYSALTGITIGAVLAAYEAGVAMLAFGVSAFFFGCMAAAGLLTRRDVSGFRSLVIFGLLALIVMQVINLFLRLDGFDTMICLAGVAIFLGITTYDSKKTKDLYYAFEGKGLHLFGAGTLPRLYQPFPVSDPAAGQKEIRKESGAG